MTKGLPEMYRSRDFNAGPQTYRDTSFENMIYYATGLAELHGRTRVLDLMCGPGKVGSMLDTVARNVGKTPQVYFADISPDQLMKAPGQYRTAMRAPFLPFKERSFDVVAARYAIKDLPLSGQMELLQETKKILIYPYGRLVVADMVAANLATQEWLNEQHALKQAMGGRDENREGRCHIPTRQGWIEMLEEVGFFVSPEQIQEYTSKVSTIDWVNGNQISKQQRLEIEEFIMGAPVPVKKAYNIREEDGVVKIDFPVVVMRADLLN